HEPVRDAPAEPVEEKSPQRGERPVDRFDLGHPHRHPGLAQAPDVELAILLLVGDHEIRTQVDDRPAVRVLGAPHPSDRQVGRVGAPVGRADQRLGARRGDRLGEGGHEADHTTGGSVDVDAVAQIVLHPSSSDVPWSADPTIRPPVAASGAADGGLYSEAMSEWTASGDWTDIRYETTQDGIAKITICRPEVHNAFRPQTIQEISRALS